MGNPDASLSVCGAFDNDGSEPDASRGADVPAESPDNDSPLLATTPDGRRLSTSAHSRSAPGHTGSKFALGGGSGHTRKAGNPLAPQLGAAEGMDETTISGHTGLGCGFGRFCCQEAQGVATTTTSPGPSLSSTAQPDSSGARFSLQSRGSSPHRPTPTPPYGGMMLFSLFRRFVAVPR